LTNEILARVFANRDENLWLQILRNLAADASKGIIIEVERGLATTEVADANGMELQKLLGQIKATLKVGAKGATFLAKVGIGHVKLARDVAQRARDSFRPR
jgi:hypothetical protein